LCAALMAEGLYCYSDDSAVLDREFRVAGMPFPVMLRKSSWPVLESRLACMERVSTHCRAGVEAGFLPSNLPGSTSPSVPVRALVFVEYQSATDHADAETTLKALTAFESLVGLQRSGFWVEHDRESIDRLVGWIARLPRHRLTYSSIDEAVSAIRGLLA
jgi:hypothetical protein